MPSIHEIMESGDSAAAAQILEQEPRQLEALNIVSDHPLHEATRLRKKSIVKLLLERGADVNATGNLEYTPLHYAAEQDAPDDEKAVQIAELLIRRGADAEKKNRRGFSPLMLASMTGHKVAKLLLKHGARLDLNSAIFLKDVKAVRRLLKSKARLTDIASLPDRLLEDAVSSRIPEILDLLLDFGGHPSPLDLSRFNSLLFHAVTQAMNDGDSVIIKRLLESGVPADVTDSRGESLLDFLKKFRVSRSFPKQAHVKAELVELLKGHGAKE